ncbi:MAG: hypothetical protein D6732_17260 [Methanobacteriota archaeon]|nr:MAG: hypothetical protein D6732_17260 [Euryarchaeota archaeon]
MSKKRIKSEEIIKSIADATNLSPGVVKDVLTAFKNIALDYGIGLKRGEPVQVPYPVRGFGYFEWKLTEPRKARNPRTGEAIDVPSRPKLSFKRTKFIS